jgi:hypothetical protein
LLKTLFQIICCEERRRFPCHCSVGGFCACGCFRLIYSCGVRVRLFCCVTALWMAFVCIAILGLFIPFVFVCDGFAVSLQYAWVLCVCLL